MSDGSARVTLEWGDGEHVFKLGMKQIRELEDKTDAGLETLYQRIRIGAWRLADLRETIRLGLIGGGMDEVAASKMMRNYFDDGPFAKHKEFAVAILLAAILGVPKDPPGGKAERGGETTAGESPSQPISESPAQSVSA